MRTHRFTCRTTVWLFSAAFALTLADASFAVIDPETAVGIWLFDDGAGGTAVDSSAMGLDADLENDPAWVDGVFGTALEFDGASSFARVPDHNSPTEALTVSVWAKSLTPGWNQPGFLVEKRNAYILHPNAGGTNVAFPICNGGCWNQPGGWADGAAGPNDITVWHMYTGTYDSATGEWKLYVDAEVISELELTKNPIDPDPGPINIGFDDCCGGARFGAVTVDEVAIFNVALPQEDLATMFELGIGQGVLAVDPREKAVSTWGRIKRGQ